MGHPGPYLHQNANHQCGTEDGPQEGLILSYSDQIVRPTMSRPLNKSPPHGPGFF